METMMHELLECDLDAELRELEMEFAGQQIGLREAELKGTPDSPTAGGRDWVVMYSFIIYIVTRV